jgi:diadenosine tetraphosphate (Ap4A) HIT family hydrolase
MHHYRKTRKAYATYNAGDKAAEGCTLCKEVGTPKILRENSTMFVIPNRVPYDLFEDLAVLDHLMIMPKRHVESLFDFSDEEKLDYMALVGEYEAQGYSIYSRGSGQVNRSVKHQHTHLLMLDDKKPKFIFYTAKPHILIKT